VNAMRGWTGRKKICSNGYKIKTIKKHADRGICFNAEQKILSVIKKS
jgi:hypothetical protein